MRYLRDIIVFLLLIMACGILLYSVYTSVEEKTIADVNNEQMIHAEQAAWGIQRFFATYNSTLSFLAGNNHIASVDPEGKRLMREFYTTHNEEISSVSRVDEHGIITYTYPYEGSIGANISGQAHVQKTVATRQAVVSEVFTAVQGFRTIAFTMPVFKNGIYKGSLTLLVPFDSLAQKNLRPIRILGSGHAWTISDDERILYSPDIYQIDRPASEVFAESPDVTRFVQQAAQGGKGTGRYIIQSSQGQVTYDAVFYPVSIGSTRWSIIVATPQNEILGTLQIFRRDLTLVFGVLVAVLLFFTYYIVRSRGIIREEEQRRTADLALRESERKYRAIIENMQDTFYRTDRDGRLVMVSPSAAGMFGYSSEQDLIGLDMALLYAEPENRHDNMKMLLQHGSARDQEANLVRRDGRVITTLANSQLLTDDEGNVIGEEGIIRDITDRKRTAIALNRATRKLNILTAITTTNIRSAAFALAGFLELEQEETAEEKRKEYHARETSLLSQITHWLAIAKTYRDLGLHPPKWQDVRTTFLLGISHLDFGKMERRLDLEEGLEVYADPHLETVFFNIAENTLHHAPEATFLALRFEEREESLVLIIEDNGPGIPAERKTGIFGHDGAPAKALGLFMAREILDITGLTIQETGRPGSGARFEILVPPGGFRYVKGSRP